jgi:hypothetical protein
VVPAAYSLLDDVIVWNQQRRERGEGIVAGLSSLRASRSRPA